MNQEKQDHRDQEGPWAPRDHLENQVEGVDPELTEPEACQDSLGQRETEALTVWLDFLVKKGTGVNPDLRGPLVLRERTEREEMMERSDPGDFLVNQGHVVCWDQRDLKDLLDLQV